MRLHRIPSLTVSYVDPDYMSAEALELMSTCTDAPEGSGCDQAPPKVSFSSNIAGVLKVNDTAVVFGLASNLATELRVWNGAATVTLANGLTYDVCESDVTCSALKVHEADIDTEALMAQVWEKL